MISGESRRLLRQLRREIRASHDYLEVGNSVGAGWARRAFYRDLDPGTLPVARLLDQLIAEGHLIKHDTTSTVARAQVGAATIVIKRYNKRGAVHSVKMLVSRTRAEKGFFKALLLRAMGIPTPEPLLYYVTHRFGVAGISYLVSSCSPGATLCDLFDAGRLTPVQWHGAVARAEETIARLHGNGITHGDVKTPNLLFDGNEVEIIDLDPLRLHHWRPRFDRFRRKDLDAFTRRVAGYPTRRGVK